MKCFIKKIFNGEIDDKIHGQFVRFGKGDYSGRAAINLQKTSKIKVKGSFEYANDFVLLASELADMKFSGIILSREKLELENEKKKAGIFSYNVSDIGNSKIDEIKDKIYFMLLDGEGEGVVLKMKKKLPKPGKSGEKKIDFKFCQLEADLKYWDKIREAFFWDVGLDVKKVKISHEYKITDLIVPKDEKDFEQIRIKTKRKGKIIRKTEVDKKEGVVEAGFEA